MITTTIMTSISRRSHERPDGDSVPTGFCRSLLMTLPASRMGRTVASTMNSTRPARQRINTGSRIAVRRWAASSTCWSYVDGQAVEHLLELAALLPEGEDLNDRRRKGPRLFQRLADVAAGGDGLPQRPSASRITRFRVVRWAICDARPEHGAALEQRRHHDGDADDLLLRTRSPSSGRRRTHCASEAAGGCAGASPPPAMPGSRRRRQQRATTTTRPGNRLAAGTTRVGSGSGCPCSRIGSSMHGTTNVIRKTEANRAVTRTMAG